MAAKWPVAPPPSWLLPWTIWRFKYPSPRPPRTDGGPKEIPTWAQGFIVWCAWVRKGRIPPRPTSTDKAPIPDRIPDWAWVLYRQLNIAVPKTPPPPPPPPPNPVPENSWKLPIPLLFTAWGPTQDWRLDADFKRFLAKVVDAQIPTIALQIGMFPDHYPDLVRDTGRHLVLWTPFAADGDGDALARAEAEGYVPQAETSSENAWALRQFQLGVGAGISRSVVGAPSAFNTFISRPDGTADGEQTTQEMEDLIDAGCTHMFVECYTGDMQARVVSSEMNAMTRWRGLYHGNPVAGLAGRPDVFLSNYEATGLDVYGRQVGVYLAEPLRPVDWADIKNL